MSFGWEKTGRPVAPRELRLTKALLEAHERPEPRAWRPKYAGGANSHLAAVMGGLKRRKVDKSRITLPDVWRKP